MLKQCKAGIMPTVALTNFFQMRQNIMAVY